MKLLLFGDSHIRALRDSYASRPPHERERMARAKGIDDIRFVQLFAFPHALQPFFAADDRELRLTDPVGVKRLAEVSGKAAFRAGDREWALAVFLAFTTTMLVRDITWQEFRPVDCSTSRAGTPLSSQVIRALVLKHFEHIIAFHRALAGLGAPVIAVSAPPLRRDDLAIVRGADPDVVLAVDRLARGIVGEALREAGIPIVEPPPEAYRTEPPARFLHDAFAERHADDTHHANQAYGALMLDRVLDHALALQRPAAAGASGQRA